MSILLKRAALATLLLGAAGVPRADAQIAGGISRLQPPLDRPNLSDSRPREQFRMNLRNLLHENPQARRLFGPPAIVMPPIPSHTTMVYGGYGGYDQGINQYQPQPEAMPQAVEKNSELTKAVAATGLFNKEGKIEWPLGLRVLPGEEVARRRSQLGAMFQVLAGQMVQGTVNPSLLVEINQAVDRLAVLLNLDRQTRQSLTSANLYEDSSRFLTKMREATRIALAVQPSGQSNPYLSSQTAGGVSSPAQPEQLAGKNPY